MKKKAQEKLLIERVEDRTEASEIAAMIMIYYSIPCLENMDALVVFPGLGETWREFEASKYWNMGFGKYFLVAGVYGKDEKRYVKQGLKDVKRKEGFYKQAHADNTRHQAEWVSDKVDELGIKTIALYVSPYHLMRASLTLIKIMRAREKGILIIPRPVNIPPSKIIPCVGKSAWDLVAGELKRIKAYQQKGDVATFDEIKEYIEWLWQQPQLVDCIAR